MGETKRPAEIIDFQKAREKRDTLRAKINEQNSRLAEVLKILYRKQGEIEQDYRFNQTEQGHDQLVKISEFISLIFDYKPTLEECPEVINAAFLGRCEAALKEMEDFIKSWDK